MSYDVIWCHMISYDISFRLSPSHMRSPPTTPGGVPPPPPPIISYDIIWYDMISYDIIARGPASGARHERSDAGPRVLTLIAACCGCMVNISNWIVQISASFTNKNRSIILNSIQCYQSINNRGIVIAQTRIRKHVLLPSPFASWILKSSSSVVHEGCAGL